jgi:hypothetical protein
LGTTEAVDPEAPLLLEDFNSLLGRVPEIAELLAGRQAQPAQPLLEVSNRLAAVTAAEDRGQAMNSARS